MAHPLSEDSLYRASASTAERTGTGTAASPARLMSSEVTLLLRRWLLGFEVRHEGRPVTLRRRPPFGQACVFRPAVPSRATSVARRSHCGRVNEQAKPGEGPGEKG